MLVSKKRWWLLLLVIFACAALVFAGCEPEEEVDPDPDEPADPDEPVDEEWPETLTLGTAGTGGVYYAYGAGWADIVSDEVEGVTVGSEETGGPGDNMFLVQDRAVDLGMITMGIGYEGWEGLEDTAFEGDPQENVRALFPMYSTYSQWWAHADAGIECLTDMDGMSVGVGPTGGTPGTYHPQMLEAVGVDADPSFAALSDLVESHADGLLDANSFSSGIPVGGFLEYEALVGADSVQLIPIEGEVRDAIIEEMPFWTEAVIPAETYDSLDEDLETVVVFNWAIVHKDLPDDLVYEIVDAVMTNHDAMMDVHDAAEETVPENVDTNTVLPMHQGAYEWFVDNGFEDDIHPDAMPQ